MKHATSKLLRASLVMGLVILALVASGILASAAPLTNLPMTVDQPDGTELQCFATGDEFFNYLHDADGYLIMQSPTTGYYVYATTNTKGKLTATNLAALDNGYYREVAKNWLGGAPTGGALNPNWGSSVLSANAGGGAPFVGAFAANANSAVITVDDLDFAVNDDLVWRPYTPPAGPPPSSASGPEDIGPVRTVPWQGIMENVVIMICFADQDPTITPTMVNNTMNPLNGPVSLKSYTRTASNGVFEINSTLVGMNGATVLMYQDSHPRSYFLKYNAATNPGGYTGDDSGPDRTAREHNLLRDAINAVNGSALLAGKNLDVDNNGQVDSVMFIIKGSAAGWAELLWPHKWQIHSFTVNLNGKRVYTYSFQMENSFDLSVAIHETLHVFSFPDLYRYNPPSTGTPVGAWDIMSSDNAQFPNTHSLRRYAGWGEPVAEITQNGRYTLKPRGSTDGITAYGIATSNSNQFILLEYRSNLNPSGFDTMFATSSTSYGRGLTIARINTSYSGNSNSPTAGTNDEVFFFRTGETGMRLATGSVGSAALNASFSRLGFGNENTSPWDNGMIYLYDGTNTKYVISNVSAAGDTISFDVKIKANVTRTLSYLAGANGALSAAYSGGGSVASGTAVAAGSNVNFTAAPALNYIVDKWYEDGVEQTATGNTYSVTNIQASKTVTVSFKPDPNKIVPEPAISTNPAPPTGLPNSTSVTVTMSIPSGAQVRYTTDGTTPTATSPQYTAPLTVTAGTTSAISKRIIAYAIRDTDIPSKRVYVDINFNAAGSNPTITAAGTGLTGLYVGTPLAANASVTFTLANGTYATTINNAHFPVTGLPGGLNAGTPQRSTDGKVVTVPITGTPTTANASTINLTIPSSVAATNVSGATAAVPVTGTVPLGPIAGTSILTYNLNGGPGTPPANVTNPTTISTNVYGPRWGYNFLGWADSSSATTAQYIPGGPITITSSKTIYAVWTPVETLALGTSKSVSINFSNKFVYFQFIPSATGIHDFVSSNNSGDPAAYLYSATGTQLAYNDDDPANGLNFKISYSLTAGTTYYYGCRILSSGTGSYNATLTGPAGKLAGGAVSGPPTFNSATPNSITIYGVTNTGGTGQMVEYAISTTTTLPTSGWQTGLTFTGLTPSTGYYVFARTQENTSYYAGTAQRNSTMFYTLTSPTITATSTGLTGMKVGQAVSGVITYTLNNGTYTNPITAANFVVNGLPGLPPGLTAGTAQRSADGKAVTVSITGTPTAVYSWAAVLPGSVPAANVQGATAVVPVTDMVTVGAVAKGNGGAVSGAPTFNSATPNSITINGVTNTGGTGQSVEYAISTTTTLPTSGWQTGLTFTGLTPSTGYYVFARTQANTNYDAGTAQYGGLFYTTSSSFVLTYNINGGPGTPPASATNPTSVSTLVMGPRWGYNFLGWSDSASATTAQYLPGGAITLTASKTIYAVWTVVDTLALNTAKSVSILYTNQFVYFKFIPATSGFYNLTSANTGTDPEGYLYTSTGAQLAYDDQSGGSNNFIITSPMLTAGTTYYYGCRMWSTGKGSYTVTLTTTKGTGGAVSGAPTLNNATSTSITVNAVTNTGGTGQTVEYAISTTTTVPTTGWQSSTTFTGRTPSTGYYVFARTAENTNYFAGTAQRGGLFYTTASPAITAAATGLTGLKVGVPIVANSAYVTYTLNTGNKYATSITSANFALSGLPSWMSQGTAQRTNDTTVTVYLSGTPTAANTSSVTLTRPSSVAMANVQGATAAVPVSGTVTLGAISKGNGGAVSGAPTFNSATSSSITIYGVTNTGGTGQTVEYAISLSTAVPTSGWQTSLTFTGLASNTGYYVFARTQSNTNYDAGTAQRGGLFYTLTGSVTLTYNLNGGPGTAPPSVTNPTAVSSSVMGPRWGYNFLGWSTSSTASAPTYLPGAPITITSNTTLYAVWTVAATLSTNYVTTVTINYTNQFVYFKFVPAASGSYVLTSSNVGCDPEGYLYTSTGTQLAYDDQSGGNNDFIITYSLTAGTTYYYGCRMWSSGKGSYTVTLTGPGTGGKLAGAPVSGPPIEDYKSTNYIVVIPVWNTWGNGQAVEYAISTSTAVPTSGWQNNTSFYSLNPNTTYFVFARTAENANYYAGSAQMNAITTTGGGGGSNQCYVTYVYEPYGAWISGNSIYANVVSYSSYVYINVEVSPGATWELYSDYACYNRIYSNSMDAWLYGTNYAYIKVTAQDGVTSQVYTLNVNREEPRNNKKKIFTTRYDSNFLNWILFIFLFGWIWMWF